MSNQPPTVNLDVPYIHQLLNTPDNFNGQLAAGPTAMVMVLAAYGKLTPRSDIYHNQPSPFGYYISNSYVGPTNFSFSETQPGPQDQVSFAGAYGACLNRGQAFGSLMANYAINHGLNAQSQIAHRLAVEAELNYGAPVVLATTLKGFGHIVVVKGYLPDGRLIVNDPFWGKPEMGVILYSWPEFGLTPFMVTFESPLPKPEPERITNGLSSELKQSNPIPELEPPESLN
ncbi:MAG: C39 family peptidase [Chloroflexi bacterium]|nr:C39 family peptidase [Chloroflexota bacterium]